MSIDDNTSENMPVIKSRTGKFLQGIFDKKAPAPRTRRTTPTSQQEFMQVVPEPIVWDEGEETNWDDDFVEAPQPTFVVPSNKPVEQPIISTLPPPPPPTTFQTTIPEPISEAVSRAVEEQSASISSPSSTTEIVSPSPTVPKAEESADRSATIEVSIPRPKNIKYKSKDLNDDSAAMASAKPTTSKNEAIKLDIQRPKNIKYKTKPPVRASLVDRLLAPIKSLFASIPLPFGDRPPTIYIEQVPANGTIPSKKTWQLPSLGHENLRQVLVAAGGLFLAMTAAWAVINFWPTSHTVVTTPPAPVTQPVPVIPPMPVTQPVPVIPPMPVTQPAPVIPPMPVTQPVPVIPPMPVTQPAPVIPIAPVQPTVSPEVVLAEAAKSRSQALASLYTPGFILNLELDTNQKLATVTVGNLWFSLTPDQQQQTAQSLWQQARNYQMSGLEVRGVNDQLLARSPFVGTEVVLTPR
jgi:hypothetical protein